MIRIIVPYPAGGTLDVTVRTLAQKLSEIWRQPVIVDNRPSAGGLVGATAVARAAPDGFTLGAGASPIHTTNKLTVAKLPFDPDRDLTPIMLLAKNPLFLIVHPSVPVKTLREFVAFAKANPGKLSYGSVGPGSPQHLAFETLKARTGIDVLHVPYKGAANATQDLVAGHIHAMIDTTAMQQVRTGALKAIAVLGDERFAGEPNLPSAKDEGVPGMTFYGWFSLFGPAGLPPEVVDKISTDVNSVLAMADVRAVLAPAMAVPVGGSPEEFKRFIDDQMVVLTEAARVADLKPE